MAASHRSSRPATVLRRQRYEHGFMAIAPTTIIIIINIVVNKLSSGAIRPRPVHTRDIIYTVHTRVRRYPPDGRFQR